MRSIITLPGQNNAQQAQKPFPIASRIRVVSLLDQKHYQQVENLWAELRRKFSVKGVYISPRPHITYHIATCYKVKSLESVLRRAAASKMSFKVRTGGLGIFTGPQPVLHIPVVRSPELTQFQEALWQEIGNTGADIEDYYHPDRWIPHITVGIGDMNKNKLAQIVRYLGERDFNWEITVDSIVLVHNVILPRFGFILRKLAPGVFGTQFSHFALGARDAHITLNGQSTTHTEQLITK